MKDKVAIYCRVSTVMQSTDRQQVFSIESFIHRNASNLSK